MDTTLLVILIVLCVVIIALLVFLLTKKQEFNYEKISNDINLQIAKEQGNLKEHLAYSISQNNERELKMLHDMADELRAIMNKSVVELNEKLDNTLNDGFKKTNETFTSILERISKIDEAQKKIESLSTEVISLQDILSDKKSRGCFGEITLYTVLSSIFGDKNDQIYERQYHFNTGVISDAILHCPEPMGNIAIDSKFPLENYERMIDKTIRENERVQYEKAFKNDFKKHIDDISSKYIIPSETSDQAILFLPAEAIFAEVNAYFPEIITYAQERRVWITSPTTLMATLSTIQVLIRNLERDKHAKEIQEELGRLSVEFTKYRARWDKLQRSIETVTNDVKDINITTNKIGKRFDEIQNVNIVKEIEE